MKSDKEQKAIEAMNTRILQSFHMGHYIIT